ncbi:hypothetical protein, partial [Rhizobium sp. CNPSo 3490]|uniref:hypothetical protein n=1 Tax=Rhizobium sp. CNPSo 3490 TaxID=3021407 RepID=UPI00254DDB14
IYIYMSSFFSNWHFAPIPLFLAVVSLIFVVHGFLSEKARTFTPALSTIFVYSYIFSNLFYIGLGRSFLGILLSQFSAVFFLILTLRLARRRHGLNDIVNNKQSAIRSILYCTAFLIGSVIFAYGAAHIPLKCTGAKCAVFFDFFGENLDYAAYWAATMWGGFLISVSTLVYFSLIKQYLSTRKSRNGK